MNLRNLQFLFMPSYWIMNYPYNNEVDIIINKLLDKYELTDLDELGLTCKLGKATIWVGNRPYASGSIYGTSLARYRPSRLTIKRLLRRVDSFNIQNHKSIVNEIRKEFYLN